MAFVVAHRIHGAPGVRGRSMLRAGRLMISRWCAVRIPTQDERANLYVSRMPIAVLSPAPGRPASH